MTPGQAGRVILTAALACAAPALPALSDEALVVPSGQEVTFQDTIWDEPGPAGLAVRFRFIAPRIARNKGDIEFLKAEEDMVHLCETYALPRLAEAGEMPAQVIITLSDRPVTFGLSDPEATQFFEAYRPDDGACVWEGF